MKKQPRMQGFTLIELMTVATIICMLAAIAVPNFLNAVVRAKVARSAAEQELIVWALESYFVDRDEYPPNSHERIASPGDLVPITTPIPYISCLPEDIFLFPKEQDRHEFIETVRNGVSSYFYINYTQPTGKRISVSPFGLKGSANYLVYGLGPAFSTDFDPQKPETLVIYNPSNGTTSRGYLTTFGP